MEWKACLPGSSFLVLRMEPRASHKLVTAHFSRVFGLANTLAPLGGTMLETSPLEDAHDL